jgi:two-component system response regulator FixJ
MAPVERDASPTGHRVYIVDDDSMVRRALFFALRAGGFEPRSFASGADFLGEADSLEAGCVLLDLRMPDIDGIAVLEALGDRLGNLPVVIISAHGEVSSAVAAMKIGAVDFVEKPFSDTTLFEILNGVFKKLPQESEAAREKRTALERLARLTPREREVLEAMVGGLSNKQIAYRLDISARTVEVHRANLMNRLEASSFAEVVRLGTVAGLPAFSLENAD